MPATKRPAISESDECVIFMDVLRAARPFVAAAIFHVANERSFKFGGGADKRWLGKLKRMAREGFTAGVSDYFLPLPNRAGKHGLFIEMKALKGRPRPAQIAFLDARREQGYSACIAYGADAALTAIDLYLASQDVPERLPAKPVKQ